MTYTILVNSDKSIEKTTFRPIFEKESRADEIQFLIDPDLLGTEDMTNYKVLLQVLLPHFNEETQEEETIGKMRYMDIEEETYLDMFKSTLPITTTLTNESGRVEFWFLFFDMENLDKIRLIKTDSCSINILPSASNTSIEDLEDEEAYDTLTVLQNQIDELNKSKLDTNFIFNEEEGTIQFYAGGEPVGDPIKIDNEVAWKEWVD
jgi:hypothetical protein